MFLTQIFLQFVNINTKEFKKIKVQKSWEIFHFNHKIKGINFSLCFHFSIIIIFFLFHLCYIPIFIGNSFYAIHTLLPCVIYHQYIYIQYSTVNLNISAKRFQCFFAIHFVTYKYVYNVYACKTYNTQVTITLFWRHTKYMR